MRVLELTTMVDLRHGNSGEGGGGHGCEHSGYYSGLGIYAREARILRYVLVCDECGEEMREISALDYVPEPLFAVS